MDPVKFFRHPKTAGQKQYEALRAFYIDHVPGKEVARLYGYTYTAFNSLKQRFKDEDLKFFMTPPRGPKGPRVTAATRQKIIEYRRKNLSAYQIAEILETFDESVSVSTISRILDEEGFPKLPRRTHLKIGRTKDNTLVPDYARSVDVSLLDGWEGDCAVGGIFLFAPLMEHFNLPSIVKKAKMPRSANITSLNYFLAMLSLKLVGKARLSQISDFNFDKGLGLFASLNVLPKATAISTYSYRLSDRHLKTLMQEFVKAQHKAKTYGFGTINLDFHTIQHYGDESVLDDHWSGARGKRVKGALTVIAQDCDSKCQIYVDPDILRAEADDQILEFVKFWRKIRGKFSQTLVFDSKLTTYENLRLLNEDGVTFISLRRRGKRLLDQVSQIPADQWRPIKLDAPKRKYRNPLIHDEMVELRGYGLIRQIIMTNNGREDPAFFITNNEQAEAAAIVGNYAKRWRVENSIEEAVSFFNLNALSSPILIKVHFDVLLTMIADTLYYHLARSLRGFEVCDAAKLFRHFVDMPAKLKVRGDEIHVRFPLRAHSPVLRSAGLDKWTAPISWLGNRRLRYEWG